MAKERRAFSDEALRQRGPEEELRVTERNALNVLPLAEAEYVESSVFLNPNIFEDLSKISVDVHNTRRHSRHYDHIAAIDEFNRTQNQARYEWEMATKMEQNTAVADTNLGYRTGARTAMEEARRKNMSSTEALEKFNSSYDKVYDNLSKASPYMAQQFQSFREQTMETLAPEAVKKDYEIAQNKALYLFKGAKDEALFTVGISGEGIDRALDDYVNLVFPTLDQISDITGAEKVQEAYNAIVMQQVNRDTASLLAGLMTPEAYKKSLLSTLYTYKDRDLRGPLDKVDPLTQERESDREATIHVTLSGANQAEILGLIAQADGSGNNTKSVYTEEAYFGYTNMDALEKGDINNAPFLRDNGLLGAKRTTAEAINALEVAGATQTEAGRKSLHNVSFRALTVLYPSATARDLLAFYQNKSGGKSTEIIKLINNIKTQLMADREKFANGEKLDYLVFTTDGLVYSDLNFPTSGPEYKYLIKNGQVERQVRAMYCDKIIETLDALSKNYDSESLSLTNKLVYSTRDKLFSAMDPRTLYVSDTNTGRVEMIKDRSVINEAFNNYKVAKKSVTSEYTRPSMESYFKEYTPVYESLPKETRDIAIATAGSVIFDNGEASALMDIDADTVSGNTAKYMERAQMFAFLKALPSGENEINSLINGPIAGGYIGKDVTPQLAGSVFKNFEGAGIKNKDSFGDVTKELLDRYNVPQKNRSALRNLFAYIAFRDFISSKESVEDYKVNVDSWEEIIDANFTKKGTYKHSSVLREKGIVADEMDSILMEKSKEANRISNRLFGDDADMSLEINEKTGSVDMKVPDGSAMDLNGTYSGLLGSGKYPVTIPISRPIDVSEDVFKRGSDDILRGVVSFNTIATATSPTSTGSDKWKYVQKMLDKYNLDSQDAFSMAVQYLKTIGDPETQQKWFLYEESDYTSMKVNPAPPQYREFIQDLWANSKGILDKDKPEVKERAGMFADFLNTCRSNGKTLALDIPTSLYESSKEVPYADIKKAVEDIGGGGLYRVTSTVGGKHYTSIHSQGKAMDIAFGPTPGSQDLFYKSGPNAGKLNISALQLFVQKMKPLVDNGSIDKIVTGWSYLVKGTGTDPDYAFIRALKNKKGEPLFRMIQPELAKKSPHLDHFHVQFNKTIFNADGTPYTPVSDLNKATTEAAKRKEINISLTENAREYVNNMTNVIETNINSSGKFISKEEAKAVATLFHSRKATEWDAKMTGRSVNELNEDHVSMALNAANRYCLFRDYLGSSELAVYAMMGAKFWMPSRKALEKSQDRKYYSAEEIIDMYTRGELAEDIPSGAKGNTSLMTSGQTKWIRLRNTGKTIAVYTDFNDAQAYSRFKRAGL